MAPKQPTETSNSMSTPAPELTEAAAIAIYYQQVGLKPPYPLWDDGDAVEKENCRIDAQLAYDAMAPLIAVQAKAEALRELTDSYMGEWPFMRKKWGGNDDVEATAARDVAMKTVRWLQQQAATIEGASK